MYFSKLSVFLDKFAISLSALCVIHCLMAPVIIALMPALAALGLAGENFHLYMVYAVLPSSVLAAVLGCRKHKRYDVTIPISIGLFILVLTAIVGGEILGQGMERALTLVGAVIIAYGHLLNYRLCQRQDCHC